eukprot:320874_1
MLTLFLPSHLRASYDYNNWIVPSSSIMPENLTRIAVGYDSINDTIWILRGGSSIFSFDINSNSFTDIPINYRLLDITYGMNEFYTQIDDILYFFDNEGYYLSEFNVRTTELFKDRIRIPSYTDGEACLASIDDALFVLRTSVEILNLTTNTGIVSPEVNS